jgi:uncharacterized membrane protein YcaP (DUF421 family)
MAQRRDFTHGLDHIKHESTSDRLTHLAGARSFSMISGFDFAVTVSIGCVLAWVILTPGAPPARGIMALAILFVLQLGVATLRVHSDLFKGSIYNKPSLIMANGEMLRDQIARANVQDFSQVDAAIAETTGDISVLHRKRGNAPRSANLQDGVINAHLYRPQLIQT